MADVVQWVSDQLHELLGLSDRYTAEFLVSLARKAPSSAAYLQQLNDTGAITVNEEVSSFATQLWDRVPHRAAMEKPARAREREMIQQRQRNKAYQLLSDEEDQQILQETRTRAGEDGGHYLECTHLVGLTAKKVKRCNLRKKSSSQWESSSEEEEEEEEEEERGRQDKEESDSDEFEW